MPRSLADFQGDRIYLDTNILVGLVDADSVYYPACKRFFQRALEPAQPIQLVTCALTLDEVVFVLLQELVAKPPYSVSRSRSQYLQNHPEVVKALMEQLAPLVEALFDLLIWEPVTRADIRQMQQEMRLTGILPGDAIHLAVMKRLGLTAIASDDEGFGLYPGSGHYSFCSIATLSWELLSVVDVRSDLFLLWWVICNLPAFVEKPRFEATN